MTKKIISIVAIITLIAMMGILFVACDDDKEKGAQKDANYYAEIFRNAGAEVEILDESAPELEPYAEIGATHMLYISKGGEDLDIIIFGTKEQAKAFWDDNIGEEDTYFLESTTVYTIVDSTVIVGEKELYDLIK